jgi:type II secretory pathway pseudopilin PulG
MNAALHPPRLTGARLTPRGGAVRAFTMIEMLGVLIIVMILTLALLPSLIKQADLAARNLERGNLQRIAAALQNKAVTDHEIPGTNTFFQDIGDAMGWMPRDVATNTRGNARVVLVNPALRIGTNSTRTLPFVQTNLGSIRPVSPRVMICSSLGAPLPAVFTNAGSSAQAVFDLLWNAPDEVAPTGWTYGGDFTDIRIQRVNLDPLFVQVILNDSTLTARYSIDKGPAVPLPYSPFTNYFLLGTVLGLYDSTGASQLRQVIQDTTLLTNTAATFASPSFVYEGGVWRGKLFVTAAAHRATGADLRAAYSLFMAATANPGAKPTIGPVTQAQVTTDMLLYMSNYVYWATNGFATTRKAGLTSAQSALSADTKNYVGK